MRRIIWILAFVVPLVLGSATVEAFAGPGCGGSGGVCGRGGCGGGGGCEMGGGSASMAEARDTFHALLGDHGKIRRTVTEIEGGVETTTVSDDAELTAKIRKHVRQMEDRIQSGDALRHWDPLFVEVFKHHDEIVMKIEDVSGGVKVRETSTNPDVVKLIRAHAQAVNEFTARGFDRAHEASQLPEGYGTSADKPTQAPSSPAN